MYIEDYSWGGSVRTGSFLPLKGGWGTWKSCTSWAGGLLRPQPAKKALTIKGQPSVSGNAHSWEAECSRAHFWFKGQAEQAELAGVCPQTQAELALQQQDSSTTGYIPPTELTFEVSLSTKPRLWERCQGHREGSLCPRPCQQCHRGRDGNLQAWKLLQMGRERRGSSTEKRRGRNERGEESSADTRTCHSETG